MKIVKIPKREEGQGLVEYALILVLVAIVVIIILTQIGSLIVFAFATIIGSFTSQPLTNTGPEGIVVSRSAGKDVGLGQCGLPDGEFSVVLVDNGEIVTNSDVFVTFLMGNKPKSGTVVIGNSGVGTVTLSGVRDDCPARLKVNSWSW